MSDLQRAPGSTSVDLDAVVDQVRRWTAEAAVGARGRGRTTSPAADRLRALLRDPAGVAFATRFVDRVLRPADDHVAARHLVSTVRELGAPGFLGRMDRTLLRAGAGLAPRLPAVVVPLARWRLRQLVSHLLVDASPHALGSHLADRGEDDAPVRRNINLLGEAVLGEEEAARRLEGTLRLIARADVDHVSVKISAVASQLEPWDLEVAGQRLRERLRTLYRAARDATPPTFVNLDMEEHRDLELTLAAFTEVLAEEEFHRLSAGVAIQAYLPDSVDAVTQVLAVARQRRAVGGVPLRIRLVKGANLSVEHVDAEWHGWVPTPYPSKADTDANYKRLLHRLLDPQVTDALHVGVASHNLFDVAYAWHLARARGVTGAVGFEMLEGMAPELAEVVRRDVGGMLLYTPVVDPADLDAATAYLVRRLEEAAAPANFLRSVFDLDDPVAFGREEDRFRASVAARDTVTAVPRRAAPAGDAPPRGGGFANEPDTDPSRPAARRRVAAALQRDPGPPVSSPVTTIAGVDAAVATARTAGARWGRVPAAERAAALHRVADVLADHRDALLAVMAHEAGKTVAEADPEVSEAIDFARWYAERARDLDDDPDAAFRPHRVVVVTPPWNFPVAIPLGGCLAALAAGAAVVVKPAPQSERCMEVAVGLAHVAGIDPEVLQLVRVPEDDAGCRLVTHPDVDAVVLTGAHATARRFRSWRPDLRLLAETSGKNALVITPSADLDLAVADLVRSAFGHAGQKCSAASLAILVGDVDADGRVRRQLVDATRALRVGPATAPATRVGPLIAPPSGDLERALTRLEPGERWLLEPQALDDQRRTWRPGIRDRVAPGSWFHHTECFGPVLGLIDVPDLEAALEVQNATAYGLTGGLHSLDDDEIGTWLAHVEVGNAYVNRSITGAIVRRQPFGGWKRSAVGPGAKAGGPHYVAQFGTWTDRPGPVRTAPPGPGAPASDALAPDGSPNLAPDLAPDARTVVTGPAAQLLAAVRGHLAADAVAWLERAAASDEAAWRTTFAHEHDPSGLRCEANVLRYRPRPWLGLHLTEGQRLAEAVRVLLAAARTGTQVRWTHAPDAAPPPEVVAACVQAVPGGPHPRSGPDAVADLAARAGHDARLRVVGRPDQATWRAAAQRDVDLAADPVTASGRRELLTVLREQAVSRTMHRYGTPLTGPAIPPPR